MQFNDTISGLFNWTDSGFVDMGFWTFPVKSYDETYIAELSRTHGVGKKKLRSKIYHLVQWNKCKVGCTPV